MRENSLLDVMERLDEIEKIVTTLQTLKAKKTEDEHFIRTQVEKIEKLNADVEVLIKDIKNGKERFEFCEKRFSRTV